MQRSEPLSPSRVKAAVDKARATDKDVWISDNDGMRGTGRVALRASPRGLPLLYFRLVVDGTRKVIPLAPYARTRTEGRLTIQEARAHARQLSAALLPRPIFATAPPPAGTTSDAVNPQRTPVSVLLARSNLKTTLANRQPRIEVTATATVPAPSPDVHPRRTVRDLCIEYVQGLNSAGKTGSANQALGNFRRHLFPAIGHIEAAKLSSEQVTDALRPLCDSKKITTARKTRAHLHAAFARAMESSRDPRMPKNIDGWEIGANPISAVSRMSDQIVPRERFLLDAEFHTFWWVINNEVPRDSIKFAGLRLDVRLGGQRGLQLWDAKRHNVDVDAATIKLYDSKGKRGKARVHVLPLTPSALVEVNRLMQHSCDVESPFLFPGEGRTQTTRPIHHGTISTIVTAISRGMIAAKVSELPFQFIDIRRTIETMLAARAVRKDVRAQLLSHGLTGVQDTTYDQHDYMQMKLDALMMWDAYLNGLLERKPACREPKADGSVQPIYLPVKKQRRMHAEMQPCATVEMPSRSLLDEPPMSLRYLRGGVALSSGAQL